MRIAPEIIARIPALQILGWDWELSAATIEPVGLTVD